MALARGKHPFPFRTRTLRPSAAMVLWCWPRESSTLPGFFMKAAPIRRSGLRLFQGCRSGLPERKPPARNAAHSVAGWRTRCPSSALAWPQRGTKGRSATTLWYFRQEDREGVHREFTPICAYSGTSTKRLSKHLFGVSVLPRPKSRVPSSNSRQFAQIRGSPASLRLLAARSDRLHIAP